MRNSKEDATAIREFTRAWVLANVKADAMPAQARRLAASIEQTVLDLMSSALDSDALIARDKLALNCVSSLPANCPAWRAFPTEIEASLSDLFDTGTRHNLTTILQLWSHVAEGLKQAAASSEL